MIEIISISNTRGIWNGVEMCVDDFNKLVSVLDLSKYQHTITYKRGGYVKTFVLNEVKVIDRW